MPLIRTEHLTHRYPALPEPITALRDVTLEIGSGAFVAIVGANGSGKSTLARHFNALLLPTEGNVWVQETNTRDSANLRTIRQNVTMVFQNPENQFVATVAEEDVAFGPENFGVPTAELQERVRGALEQVGLTDLRLRAPHELSAGQQQRLAIAGALAIRPAALVLDEATSMLDPRGKASVQALASSLYAGGLTVAAITQSMEEAAAAEQIVVMDRGQIAATGTPGEVFSDASKLATLGLDLPPAAALAQALNGRIPNFPASLLNLKELEDEILRRWWGRHTSSPIVSSAAPQPAAPRLAPLGEPLIRARGLQHTYLRGTPRAYAALRGIDLDVYPGEIVGVVGAAGSGKSTLLQHLNGLLRPGPGDGQVVVDGVNLADPRADVRALRRRVGLVFQFSERQLFERYVGDDVAFGPRQFGYSRAEVRARVQHAMSQLGLDFEEFKDRVTLTLSGGQKRRVALAGVLALEPRILVLDEPTAGLDPRGRDEFLALLHQWREREHMTVVLVSHHMDEIARVCDRVYVLDSGRVALNGTPRELFGGNADIEALGLTAPPFPRLAQNLLARGMPISGIPLTLDEATDALVPLIGPVPAA